VDGSESITGYVAGEIDKELVVFSGTDHTVTVEAKVNDIYIESTIDNTGAVDIDVVNTWKCESVATVDSTTTSSAGSKLIDTSQAFTSIHLNTTVTRDLNGTATVTAVDSGTQLSLSSNLMASGEDYTIHVPTWSQINSNINLIRSRGLMQPPVRLRPGMCPCHHRRRC